MTLLFPVIATGLHRGVDGLWLDLSQLKLFPVIATGLHRGSASSRS